MVDKIPIHKYFNVSNSTDALWFLVLIFVYVIFVVMLTIGIQNKNVLMMQKNIWVTT